MRRIMMLAISMLVVTLSQTGWTATGGITVKQLKAACTITIQIMDKFYIPNSPEKATQAIIDSTTCTTYLAATNDTMAYATEC